MKKRWAWSAAGLAVVATVALAGEQTAPETHVQAMTQWIGDGAELPMVLLAHGEPGLADKLVKGAPYSAEAVTESVQTLADGNRIVRKTTASVARDADGRTRREQSLGPVGPPGAAAPHQRVLIDDPVAGTHFVLDPDARTAVKQGRISVDVHPRAAVVDRHVRIVKVGEDGKREVVEKDLPPGAPAVPEEADLPPLPPVPPVPPVAGANVFFERLKMDAGKSESLGKQDFDGVAAEGTRTTMTIPAGQIGNEQPITVVSERWYSPDLQTVVMSRHVDPRFGETTYRLTGITRGDQPRSLFEVPSDYKVSDGPLPGEIVYKKIEKIEKIDNKK